MTDVWCTQADDIDTGAGLPDRCRRVADGGDPAGPAPGVSVPDRR